MNRDIPFTFTEANVAIWLQYEMVSDCWLRFIACLEID